MLHLRLAFGLALIAGSRALAAPLPVTGWVGDAHGKPLPGARITLSPLPSAFERQRRDLGGPPPGAPEPQKAASGPAGSFALAAEAGMWTVRLEAAGAVPFELDLAPLVEPRELPPFRTGSAEDVGIEVRVVDRAGKPVAGARVSIPETPSRSGDWRTAPRWGETGPDGRLRLPRARGERLKLRVLAPGFPPAEAESAEASVLVRLSPAPARTVEVRDADGRPVAGALVAPGPGLPAAALTDEAGRAAVFPRAGKSESPVAWTADGRRAKASPPPPEADPAAPLAIRLPRTPDRASGQVVDRLDRHPLAGALVWPTLDPAGWARADGRGGYALPTAAEGATGLSAAMPGYLPAALTLPPPRRGERTLRAPTFALQPGAGAEGVVVDAAGRPVAGARVSAADATAETPWSQAAPRVRSGADGRFALRSLAPGKPLTITAALPGFLPAQVTLAEERPFAVRSGLRLVLRRGRTARGRVVDGAGQPVAEAAIRPVPFPERGPVPLFAGSPEPVTTDAAGRFEIAGLPAGKLDLAVRAPGFAPVPMLHRQVPAGEGPFDLPPIRLDRGTSVAGTVVDRQGNPVAGADVRAVLTSGGRFTAVYRQPGGDATAVSGPDGRFTLKELPQGAVVDVTAEREGLGSRTQAGVAPPLAAPLRLVLSPASRISGEVVDESGAPVPGAHVAARADLRGLPSRMSRAVMAGFRGAAAGEDGRFEIPEAPAGKLAVSASADGFLSASLPLELAPEQSRDDLRIVLRRGATVTGRVLAPDGTPAVGARVSLAASPGPGVEFNAAGGSTDGDGAYVLDGVPPGPRTFTARLEDALPAVRDLTVRPGENRLDFQLGSGLEVAGRVLDPAGAPASGARVSLANGDSFGQETASGDDGSFRFSGLRAGAYRLSARLAGFAPASQELRLADAPLRDVELRLGGSGAIAGHLGGVAPEQLAQVQVFAIPPRDPDQEFFSLHDATPDPTGEYRIADLAPGEWSVSASLNGRHAEGKVQVPPGGEARLDLDLPGGGFTLRGRLLRAGQPFTRGAVQVQGAGGEAQGAQGSAVLDSQGAFRIEGLKAGIYELAVRAFGAGVAHRETLEIAADREVEIDLPSSEVRGRVVDADSGSPVAEAAVSLELQSPGGPGVSGRFGGAQTGPDGAFSLQGGDEGDYRVQARKEGYAPAESLVHLPERTHLTVTVPELAGRSGGAGSATLEIVGADGLPYRSFRFGVLFPEARLTEGRADLDDLPPGAWRVRAKGPAGRVWEGTAVTAPGAPAQVALR